MIILDTHAFVWWVAGSKEIPAKALGTIRKAQAVNGIYVSSISIWELSMLMKTGRLLLSIPLQKWIRAVEDLPFVKFVPVDNAIAELSVNLPGEFHKDPADRIIVATAQTLNMPVITRDGEMRKYPHVRTIWR
ncbi:MAG TPA: type II toxin-antitoxin system VapC family toxin [Spirochaetota bacterium]|nr:type II toxin-antitoxin system VapC family toxin [Spirochaetota bacterium]